MDVKKVALLIGALVIAVVTAVMAKNMFSGAGAEAGRGGAGGAAGAQGPGGAQGASGRHDHRCRKPRLSRPGRRNSSRALITPRAAPDGNVAKMIGTVVRNPITAGQPITKGSLVGPNDRGFLAAALGPGMRAVTVPVSTTSGVAGFIFPGDRVDMVLTQDGRRRRRRRRRSRCRKRSSATCACSPPTSASTARMPRARPKSRPSPR